jgi:hypothetical protein
MEFPVIDIKTIILSVLASGGGATLVAYLAIKNFGASWLESKFSQRLESFRHSNSKEIEKFKFEIDGVMRAQQRYQEKQFETIVELWQLYRTASAEIAALISPLQQYADVSSMSVEMRRQFISTLDLLPAMKEEILDSHEIQATYQKTVYRMQYGKAAKAFHAFNVYLLSRELFLGGETYNDFVKIADAMHSVLVNEDIYGRDEPSRRTRVDLEAMLKERKTYNSTLAEVRAKLVSQLRSKYGLDPS